MCAESYQQVDIERASYRSTCEVNPDSILPGSSQYRTVVRLFLRRISHLPDAGTVFFGQSLYVSEAGEDLD